MNAQTRAALQIAAERMGLNNYRAGLATHVKKGRSKHTYRYVPTAEHEAIVQALNENWDDDRAMGLLHQHDVLKQRLVQKDKE